MRNLIVMSMLLLSACAGTPTSDVTESLVEVETVPEVVYEVGFTFDITDPIGRVHSARVVGTRVVRISSIEIDGGPTGDATDEQIAQVLEIMKLRGVEPDVCIGFSSDD